MGLFGFLKSQQYIESIEWTESAGETIVYSYPMENRQIKMGAQLTVMDAQAAVFVSDGKVADVFGPGQYVLSVDNLPVLSALLSWQNGRQSSFEAAVFFVNTSKFHDLKWGTASPVSMEDAEYGTVKFKAAGSYAFKIIDVAAFMKGIFGTNQIYETAYLIGQHKGAIALAINEVLAQTTIPVAELVERRAFVSQLTDVRLRNRFGSMGLELSAFAIELIVLPDELIAEIAENERRKAEEARRLAEEEERRRAEEEAQRQAEEEERQRAEEEALRLAEEEASREEEQLVAAEAAMLAEQEAAAVVEAEAASVTADEYVPELAEEQAALQACVTCGHELAAGMKFCSECGTPVAAPSVCGSCGYELRTGMKFCPECGEKA